MCHLIKSPCNVCCLGISNCFIFIFVAKVSIVINRLKKGRGLVDGSHHSGNKTRTRVCIFSFRRNISTGRVTNRRLILGHDSRVVAVHPTYGNDLQESREHPL